MTQTTSLASNPPSPASTALPVALLCAGAVLVAMRLHAFELPLETDECNYAYTAGRLLAGDRLYEDVWDHQPPGVFGLFAAATTLFGSDERVFRWMAVGFSLVSMLLIHRVAHRAFGPVAALLAAATFAVTSSDPGTAGEGCNREIYMNTCALAAVAAMMDARRGRRGLLLAGAFLGIGSTFKTIVAAQWFTLAIWAVWRRRDDRPESGSSGGALSIRAMILYLAIGPAAIWLGVTAYFAATGRFAPFIDAVFTYNLGYSDIGGTPWQRLVGFFDPIFNVFQSAAPLWWIAAVAGPGLIVLCRGRLDSVYGLLIAYAAGSFLAVCLPGRFWPHYYYLMLPSLILLGIALFVRFGECVTTRAGRRAIAASGGIGLAAVTTLQFVHYRALQPGSITAPHPVYRYRQAWSRAQGRRIADLTDPQDSIFIWGRDAGVYFYSGRRSASRYTMVGALVGKSPDVERRRRLLIDDLTRDPPRMVLVVEPEFAELESFLRSRYVLAGRHAVDRHDDNPDKIVMVALMDAKRPVAEIDWEWPEQE